MRPVAEVHSLIIGQLDLEAATVLEAVDDLACKAIGFFPAIFFGRLLFEVNTILTPNI